MALLKFYYDDSLIFVHALIGPRLLIGRSQRCDISLPATDVSRVHCIITNDNTGYHLVNRSQFGTLIDGNPADRTLLSEGDVIELGGYRLVFSKKSPPRQLEQCTAKRINPLANSVREECTPPLASSAPGKKPKANRSKGHFMVGKTPSMTRLYRHIQTMARHSAPVLITGESGTGKELTARALHNASANSDGPFIAINCAAIADTLFESELFGHEKGAFSGALARKDGAFLAADGGTLFLDEIGELRYDLQAKLLRVLETGEVRRVGSTTTNTPHVRIIAATNRSLPEMVRDKQFREDLLYRLSILTLQLPPLRDRVADIPELSRAILSRHQPNVFLSEEALSALNNHRWPGNVRELRNVLLRALIMHGPPLRAEHFEFTQWLDHQDSPATKSLDRDTLETALLRNEGNRSQTARELGIPRSTLIYKIKHWEISA
jgi:DNA-binding NtrC family response regulator